MSQRTLPSSTPDTAGDATTSESTQLREGQYEYATPLEVIRPISEAVGGFELDPCASPRSRLAETNIRGEGGLVHDWGEYESVWLNHPFGHGEPPKWLRKAAESDADLVVALSKADPSTEWFQTYLVDRANLLCFPSDRVPFVGFEKGFDSPVVFSVFGEFPAALREHFERIGWVPSDERGYNEFRQPATTPLLTDVSRADTVRVKFSSPITVRGEIMHSATLTPLCRTDRDDGVVELACVLQHDDGTETWVSLRQERSGSSDHSPSRIIVEKNDGGRSEWEHVFIDRVVVPTDQRHTHPPTSSMIVV